MNTSYSLQADANERIENYRTKHYPDSEKTTRSNFILGKMIDAFPMSEVHELIKYQDLDYSANKKARSVTLSSDIHTRLKKIANLLNLTESQTCRYILYYMSESHAPTVSSMPSEVEEAIASLRKAVTEAEQALKTIEEYYSKGK